MCVHHSAIHIHADRTDIPMHDLSCNTTQKNEEEEDLPLEIQDIHAVPIPSLAITISPFPVTPHPQPPRSNALGKLDHRIVKNVLDTRPTLQLGRSMSMRFRARSAFSKMPASSRSSMPQNLRSRSATVNYRKQYR